MKIYIKSTDDINLNLFAGTPFLPKVGMSYYDNFLNLEDLAYMRKAKNRDGKIVMMSPAEYFDECSKYGFSHVVDVDKLIAQRRRDNDTLEWMKSELNSGHKFDLCFINYADHTQEGLHRMMALGDLYGWNEKYPVLAVVVADPEIENRWKLVSEAHDFRNYDFEKVCKLAVDEISDWKSPPPSNLKQLLRDQIIEEAKYYEDGYDIDVEIDEELVDGDRQLEIYLSRYGDYEFEVISSPCRIWVSDMYDIGTKIEPFTEDPDLDDLDIADLFFR